MTTAKEIIEDILNLSGVKAMSEFDKGILEMNLRRFELIPNKQGG